MKETIKTKILKNLQQIKYMGFNYCNPIELNLKENIVNDISSDINDLENLIKNCNLCSFAKTRKNILIGEGNLNADIVFLNMAPSVLEDENGKLLLGKTGDMLKKISTNILNMKIEDIYILNILKCIPNKDIVDSSYEISLCKPYIQKQLDIINPKLIISFGDSYKYLDTNNIKVIKTFDPIFILRNPSYKKEMMNDLEKAKLIMEQF